jgi:hypothetical protein
MENDKYDISFGYHRNKSDIHMIKIVESGDEHYYSIDFSHRAGVYGDHYVEVAKLNPAEFVRTYENTWGNANNSIFDLDFLFNCYTFLKNEIQK